MLIATPRATAVRKVRAVEILRGVAVGIQILLLALLIVGRAFGVSADAHSSHGGMLSIVPSAPLSSAN